jgi:hypothetical protein
VQKVNSDPQTPVTGPIEDKSSREKILYSQRDTVVVDVSYPDDINLSPIKIKIM